MTIAFRPLSWACALTTAAWMMGVTPSLAQGPMWVGSWASAQQIPEPNNALAVGDLTDATLRQTIRVSIGGDALRLRLSNAFGTAPLTLGPISIARSKSAGSDEIDPLTSQVLKFQGKETVTIPPGAELVSDPLSVRLNPQTDLAISLYYATPPAQQTGHPGSRTTSYYLHGEHTSDVRLAGANSVTHWENIAAVDVRGSSEARAVVIVGDSITDGRGSTTNGNNRWPDILAQRLTKARLKVGVLNAGLGGNRVLNDGLGPNAVSRINRDVLAQANARYVIIFEGVNDLGGLAREAPATAEAHAYLVTRLKAGYAEMVRAAREHGMLAYGATIAPFTGSDYYHPDAATEADRQEINAWIRSKGNFDAVIDFDALLRDPARPDRLLAAYDSGDHLHPGPDGYLAMGQSIPLTLFKSQTTARSLKAKRVRRAH